MTKAAILKAKAEAERFVARIYDLINAEPIPGNGDTPEQAVDHAREVSTEFDEW